MPSGADMYTTNSLPTRRNTARIMKDLISTLRLRSYVVCVVVPSPGAMV